MLDDIGVPKDSRGSFYNANSQQCKQLSASKQINDFVKMTVSKVLDENIETVDISEERINKAMEGKI